MQRKSQSIGTANAPAPVGDYPHARRVGDLLFLSGIGPRSPGTDKIPGVVLGADGQVRDYDIATQCKAVFANVRAVLEASGSSWEQLVDVTVYLTDIRRDFEVYNRIWSEHFTADPPCRTTLEVNRLPTPIAIELKCIATV